jgi:hypothetical protein
MAMAMKGPLRELYFGFDLERLLLRVDCEGPAARALEGCDACRVALAEPAGVEVRIDRPGRPDQAARLYRHGEEVPCEGLEVAVDRIVEVAIPFAALGVEVNGPVQFFVELLQGGQCRDRAPRQGAIHTLRPSGDFERIMWDV